MAADTTEFTAVTAALWTSFNSLHTRNNLTAFHWAAERGLEPDQARLLLDFGCGTGETVARLAGLGLLPSTAQIGEQPIFPCTAAFSLLCILSVERLSGRLSFISVPQCV